MMASSMAAKLPEPGLLPSIMEGLKPVGAMALPLVMLAFKFSVTPTFLVILPPAWSST